MKSRVIAYRKVRYGATPLRVGVSAASMEVRLLCDRSRYVRLVSSDERIRPPEVSWLPARLLSRDLEMSQ